MDSFRIFTECNADTLVVARVLGLKKVVHKDNNAEVLKALQKVSGRAVGVIDDDREQPGHFDKYSVEERASSLILMSRPDAAHKLIVISPAIEGRLLNCANLAGVDPSRYGFRNQKRLKQICKSVTASDNQDLLDFINTIKQKNPPPVATLKKWIRRTFK